MPAVVNRVVLDAAAGLLVGLLAGPASASASATTVSGHRAGLPIRHLVVIFQENVSFDHYFGTYPYTANTDGSPFTAKPGTPSVNGLSGALLTANPNGTNPRRYSAASVGDVLTCDQDHDYADEQRGFRGRSDGPVPAERRHRQRQFADRRAVRRG